MTLMKKLRGDKKKNNEKLDNVPFLIGLSFETQKEESSLVIRRRRLTRWV